MEKFHGKTHLSRLPELWSDTGLLIDFTGTFFFLSLHKWFIRDEEKTSIVTQNCLSEKNVSTIKLENISQTNYIKWLFDFADVFISYLIASLHCRNSRELDMVVYSKHLYCFNNIPASLSNDLDGLYNICHRLIKFVKILADMIDCILHCFSYLKLNCLSL